MYDSPGIQQPARIPGLAGWQPCLNKAAMLILDIYNYDDAELTPRLRREKALLWDHWERGWSMELTSGMFCRIYYPKLSGDLTPLDVCPPALVFRGSEMNAQDLDELAVHVELNCTITPTGVVDWIMEPTQFNQVIPTVSPTGRFPPTATRAQLRAAGLQEQPLILPSTGQEVIAAGFPGLALGTAQINWTGSASLFYGQNGDWPTNISQALGQRTPQYLEAATAAHRAADDAVRQWNSRLLILGHSLGGGLASCAAMAAKKRQPDLQIRANTFNAAGLHQETARTAARSSLSQAASAGIRSRQIAGDILTSLQTRNLIPLVSDILRWGGVTLPPAVPTSSPSQGISPGGAPSMMFSHWERAPEWERLPVLFPLDRQTLIDSDFQQLSLISNAAASAPDFRAFVSNLLHALFRTLGDSDGRVSGWRAMDLYTSWEAARSQAISAGPLFLSAVQSPPPIPAAQYLSLGDSSYVRDQVEPFFNGLIRDAIGVTHVMKAAVDYHMWDACAYTFVLER